MSKVDPHTRDILSRCKSPIERSFLQALLALGWQRDPDRADALNLVHHAVPGTIEHQVRVVIDGLGYIPDFYFSVIDGNFFARHGRPIVAVAIELDGHNFHQGKEAVARDRSRDRAFARAGIFTLRFTGAEVHADASHCAEEAHGTLVCICKAMVDLLDGASEP